MYLNTHPENRPLDLNAFFWARHEAIDAWITQAWSQLKAPVYSSVDVRNAGYKLAPVDTNLFPAGYNNLTPEEMPFYAEKAREAVLQHCPTAKKLLLVPENHTRNLMYLENVRCLLNIFKEAGFDARIGSLLPDLKEPMNVELPSGNKLLLTPLARKDNRLVVEDFVADVILLNNDLTSGVPDILKGIEGQINLVPLRAGWWSRTKSGHFKQYNAVVKAFAEAFSFDEWLINPYFDVCHQINFQKREGSPCIFEVVDNVLKKIQKKYDQYGITDQPFVIIKADAGTYGMGIMTVTNIDQVAELNRKQRNKMSFVKEGKPVESVLIQEGVYTFETIDGGVAESVIYSFGSEAVGGFYRVNDERRRDENLNAAGMRFVPFDLHKETQTGTHYANAVIGRLAALAAAREIAEMEPL